MAENEIAKHVKAAYDAANDPKRSWLHRLKEVLIEIFIIVFAVTISIWFHNWSDSLHEHKEEREFLVGLKKDIQGDLDNADSSRAYYARESKELLYFLRVGAGMPLNSDSVKAYGIAFGSNTTLYPHISRYEGLKGSGKFGIIENKDLLNDIINLHEETIKQVELLNSYYTDFATRIGTFIQGHAQLDSSSRITNTGTLLRMPEMRFQMMYGRSLIVLNILPIHDSCIVDCQQLIHEIDKELK